MLNNPHLTKITIPVHVLCLAAIATMFIHHDWIWLWAAFIGWVLIGGYGIAIGFHRILSHRAMPVSELTKRVLTVLGTIAGQGSSIFWVALHRGYHHPKADTEKDYHSPVHGKWNAYMGWINKLKPTDVNLKHSVDLLRDPFHVKLHEHYNKIFWAVLIVVAIINWKLALYGLVIPITLAQHQENIVNVFGHTPVIGYRNFDSADRTINNPILAILCWGQGWHNNHHHAPASFDFGTSVSGKWWEFDICRLLKVVLK